MKPLFPAPQGSDGFTITPSDTLDVKDDVANYERVESVFLHNPDTAGTVRVMPAGKKVPVGFTFTGTSGTANVTINGTAYLATFNTSLAQTVTDFITSHAKTLKTLNIDISQPSGSAVLIIRGALVGSVSMANVSGNLAGTVLSKTPITIYLTQGAVFPLPVSRVYATTPTPPSGMIGLYGGSR